MPPLVTFVLCLHTVLEFVSATVQNNKYHNSIPPSLNEVSLRHLTVDEALPKLDQYLHDAYMAGFYQVRVIHGKGGTGILRQVVREKLGGHPLVKSFRPGGYGEGGSGVTVVELTEK